MLVSARGGGVNAVVWTLWSGSACKISWWTGGRCIDWMMEMGYELLTLELCIKRRTEINNGCQCLPFASGVRLAVCFSVFVAAGSCLGSLLTKHPTSSRFLLSSSLPSTSRPRLNIRGRLDRLKYYQISQSLSINTESLVKSDDRLAVRGHP